MDIAFFDYSPDLSRGSLFSPSFLALSVLFSFSSSFVSCACVYFEQGTAGERGTVVGVSWWAGRGEVARNVVAVFVVRRLVCLEIQGMHEWAL